MPWTSLPTLHSTFQLIKNLRYETPVLSSDLVNATLVMLPSNKYSFREQGSRPDRTSRILLFGDVKYAYNHASASLNPVRISSEPIIQEIVDQVNKRHGTVFNSMRRTWSKMLPSQPFLLVLFVGFSLRDRGIAHPTTSSDCPPTPSSSWTQLPRRTTSTRLLMVMQDETTSSGNGLA